ncbi:MAG: polysaccharide deacetylase family protein [Bacteroidales bacterium]|nr:polysaccharide deacetylase family protein [Bacteroidales bacterium]
MLRYQKILIVSVLLLVLVLILDYYYYVGIGWYAGIILVTIGLLAYGSIAIRSGFYSEVICSATSREKVITLTFDDGPDEKVTPQVLELLKKHNIQAAFFCVGSKVMHHPLLIERMDNEGHIIGGHSFSHHYLFDLFSYKKILEELVKTEKIIQRVIHKKITLFRPPYGITNPMLAKALRKMNYHVIGWNLWSKDTVIKDEQKLYERLIRKLGTVNIVLLHDNRMHLIPVLEKFIKFAKENNYRFKRLDYLLQIEAYA